MYSRYKGKVPPDRATTLSFHHKPIAINNGILRTKVDVPRLMYQG